MNRIFLNKIIYKNMNQENTHKIYYFLEVMMISHVECLEVGLG